MSLINPSPPQDNTPLDPHHLWDGLGLDAPLSYNTVLAGFARYLVHAVRPSWDLATVIKQRWYFDRDEGLRAWCLQAAKARLAVSQRATYTLLQFHELIFSEQMRSGGREAMKDPVWSPLFEHMQRTGQDTFFRNLHYLFNQTRPSGQLARWWFYVLWDRGSVPFEFWSYPAIARYLSARLPCNVAPREELLRQWGQRMELRQTYPSVVTDYDLRSRTIPEGGFHLDALQMHGIPYDPAAAAAAANNQNTA
jgi:hypothetical protein